MAFSWSARTVDDTLYIHIYDLRARRQKLPIFLSHNKRTLWFYDSSIGDLRSGNFHIALELLMGPGTHRNINGAESVLGQLEQGYLVLPDCDIALLRGSGPSEAY